MPSANLELRTWRHFDDAAELIEAWGPCAETLQKRAVRSTTEKEGDWNIVEGRHLNYDELLLVASMRHLLIEY